MGAIRKRLEIQEIVKERSLPELEKMKIFFPETDMTQEKVSHMQLTTYDKCGVISVEKLPRNISDEVRKKIIDVFGGE